MIINNPSEGEFIHEIKWNKEEFVQLVSNMTEQYNGLTYTEEQMKEAKEDRAKLNAMKKAISDRRIEVKKAIMEPYDKFEAEVKEVVSMIDAPISLIDKQIKEYEDRKKEEKKQELMEFFLNISAELEIAITFDNVFDSKYLNASVSIKKAKEDIQSKVDKIKADLEALDGIEDSFKLYAKDIYSRSLDLSKAMSEVNRLRDIRKKEEAEEQRKLEAERLRLEREQQERIQQAKEAEEKRLEALATNNSQSEQQPEKPVFDPMKGIDQQNTEDGAKNQEVEPNKTTQKQCFAAFTVYGTKEQVLSVKQFMVDNGIRFEKGQRITNG